VLGRIDLASCVALDVGLRLAVADSWFGKDELARWNELRAAFDASGAPRHGRLSVRALAPAVSASLWCDRADEARRLVDSVTETLVQPLGTYQAMVLTFARAMLAEDDETDSLFRRVVDDPAHAAWAFELANARLEYGRWLRRHRRFPEAQNQLLPALRTFERLGTAPWVAEARTELQRAGGELESPDGSIWTSLTAQERQIVRLAATGKTNREIGQSLFLSPRTVGVHLYNAFPKLGVTARRQLPDLVERFDR
jgi:DNA-binding CsgD family transcriptional regulator